MSEDEKGLQVIYISLRHAYHKTSRYLKRLNRLLAHYWDIIHWLRHISTSISAELQLPTQIVAERSISLKDKYALVYHDFFIGLCMSSHEYTC
jgi:hypothetical protein